MNSIEKLQLRASKLLMQTLDSRTYKDEELVKEADKIRDEMEDLLNPKKSQEPACDMSEIELCTHCKMDIKIRNPSGFCDHLYYPDNCEVCIKNANELKTEQEKGE